MGITLIALIITIILLLILAGVTIHFILGENGILRNAEVAGNKYKQASENETNMLDQIYVYMNGEKKLPPNTPTTKAGTPVEMPESWYKDTPAYYENGKEIEKSKKTASVYAVSDGLNNTIPIPVGFYYVGGNLESGVVISDNEKDANKYKDLSDVPSGLKLNSNGELESDLKGNQFVWIPCLESNYKKCNIWNGQKQYYLSNSNRLYTNSEWDMDTASSEIIQIKKYGGFYVGRFEAGLSQNISEAEEKITEQYENYNVINIPQSKPGIVPWINITYTNAKLSAQKMYDGQNNTVSSGLITGTQWDVILNTILEKTELEGIDMVQSESWGNHRTNIIGFIGRVAFWDASDLSLHSFSR